MFNRGFWGIKGPKYSNLDIINTVSNTRIIFPFYSVMARYVTIILISMEPDQIDSMIRTNLIQFLQTQERMAANI